MLTKLAGDPDVLVMVTSRVYSSPALTISGCVKVKVKEGFLTNTEPAALPLTVTGPTGSPIRVPVISISMT